MNFSLALSGGGARGFAHFGVLMELSQAGFAPSAIAGTSMGAIVGAFYAAGQDPDYMVKLLATMDLSSFFGVPGSYRAVVEEVVAKSLVEMVRRRPWWELNTARTSRFLAFLRLFTKGKKFEELGTPLTVVACDVASGEEVRISEGPVYLGVGASAALPGLLGPVRWQGRLLIDGGVVNNLPIDAVANNADFVVAVDVSDPVSSEPSSLLDFFLHIHDITSRALYAVQLERMRERLGERLILIRPELDGIGILDFWKLPVAVEAGRAATRPIILELRNRR